MSEPWQVSKIEVTVSYEGGIPIVRASGECDLITSRKLKDVVENLIETGHCHIVFDFREMTYIDSSGFRALLEARNKAIEKGGNIALISMTPPVERVFDLLHLGELITRTETVQEAVGALGKSACA